MLNGNRVYLVTETDNEFDRSAKQVSDNSLLSILEFLEKGTGIEVHTSILAQNQIRLDYEPKMQD